MSQRTCDDAIQVIDAEIFRIQNAIISLEIELRDNSKKIRCLQSNLDSLEDLKKGWETKRTLCTC